MSGRLVELWSGTCLETESMRGGRTVHRYVYWASLSAGTVEPFPWLTRLLVFLNQEKSPGELDLASP